MVTNDATAIGKLTVTLTVTNQVDQILADRGFISQAEVRSLTLENVLVDTGATRLCLPASVIRCLGLTPQEDVAVKTAVGVRNVRLFNNVLINVEGREGTYNCLEVPDDAEALLGLIPLEDLGLEPDLQHQRLRHLPKEGKDTYLTIL